MEKVTLTCTGCAQEFVTSAKRRSKVCPKCAAARWEANCLARGEDPAQVRRDKKNTGRTLARLGLAKEEAEWHRNAAAAAERNLHFEQTLALQGGLCAITRQPEQRQLGGKPTALSRDHAHDTGQYRGLLTRSANAALGYFRENTALLERAAKYLEFWREEHLKGGVPWMKYKRYPTEGVTCHICGGLNTHTRLGKVLRPTQDHCHVTGYLRGVLCHTCNLGLSHLNDRPEWLRRAAEYLLAWGRPAGVDCSAGPARLTNPPPARAPLDPKLQPTGVAGVGRPHYEAKPDPA